MVDGINKEYGKMLRKFCLSLILGLSLLSAPVFAADTININTATQAQLETLSGVGPATAAAIIEYREQVGKFKTVDELTNVKGIGDKKLSQFTEQITVTDRKKEAK